MTEPVDVDRLQALYDATEPIWKIKTQTEWEEGFDFFEGPNGAFTFPLEIEPHECEFVQESHNAMPALLYELRRLRAALALANDIAVDSGKMIGDLTDALADRDRQIERVRQIASGWRVAANCLSDADGDGPYRRSMHEHASQIDAAFEGESHA